MAAALTRSRLLVDDLANALALLDIQQREHKEEETKISWAIIRTVGEMVAVEKKLDAAEARIIELEDVKEQVAAEKKCNRALADDLADCMDLLDLADMGALEARERDGNTIYRLVDRVEAVQKKLDAANGRLKELGAAVIE